MSQKMQVPLINVGGTYILPKKEILGVFDLDTASTKTDTKRYLSANEKKGRTINVGYDLPKSFVVVASGRKEQVYFTQLSSATIQSRWKRQAKHF